MACGIPFYFFLRADAIAVRGWEVVAPVHARIISLVLLVLVVEAARRSAGLIFTVLVIVIGSVPLYASYLPSPFNGTSFGFWRMVCFHAMGGESLLGIPMKVVGTLLLGFMIFAVGLVVMGGGQFFLDLALSVAGRIRGGPAKVSIVSSSLFGTISGSAVANVLVDGPITIPLMAKSGYPLHYAAAIETVTSTGGVIMPPVMGAAAFLIAQFLDIPYATVAIGAAVPALLYYFGLFLQIDAYAARKGLKGLPKEAVPSFREALKGGWFFMICLLILGYYIFIARMEAEAPFYALGALFVLALIRPKNRSLFFRNFVQFLERSAQVIADIMAVMLGVGVVVGALIMTGIAAGFSSEIARLAGNNIYLLLFFCAFASFILGMGMTITACYVLLAILIGPALIDAGVYPLAAHLFILYWGMVSCITPPVAVAAFAAAGIANCSPMKTGYMAMRLGSVIFFIPFVFAIHPALILHGTVIQILLILLQIIPAVALMAWGMEGYVLGLGTIDRLYARVALFISGCLIGFAGAIGVAVGFCLAALTMMIYLKQRRQRVRIATRTGVENVEMKGKI
jgi:TRAP transporter 4TM/12TM fusion protein